MARRKQLPGEIGHSWRKKAEEHGIEFSVEEKLRLHYALTEQQIRNAIIRAGRMLGRLSENLALLLEGRADNVVYRSGFARTIPAARLLITHGHVLINGRRARSPSLRVREGDQITVRQSSREHPLVIEGRVGAEESRLPSFLEHIDPSQDQWGSKVVADPLSTDSPVLVESA